MSELIVTIMFYLHLLIPGESYSYEQIQAIYMNNENAVSSVQNDVKHLHTATSMYGSTSLGMEWEEPLEPIHIPPVDIDPDPINK